MIRRKLARWYLGVDSTLNNCYLYCIQIDWERNHNLIYCERICMMFEWKCWTNWVICSKYNAAWFVGGLNDDIWELIDLWTIVSWIVSRFILSEIMRWCMYNGRICMLIEWECWTNWVIYSRYNAAWILGDLKVMFW